MIGGVVGALHGASGLPSSWIAKVEANPDVTYRDTAQRLALVVRRRIGGVQAENSRRGVVGGRRSRLERHAIGH